MNTTKKDYNRVLGGLLIAGAVGIFIPYNILIVIFDYPDILRQDTATILTRFHEGGSALIWTWFAFALSGLPLFPAYMLIGQKLERETPIAGMGTTIGIIGLVVQMVGLLRWTFVVPVLADTFLSATDEPTKAAAVVAFKTIHQFAGAVLGEHVGQLFTIAWTLMISFSLLRSKSVPAWVGYAGYGSSLVYLLAQLELLSTVIPGLPVWDLAGLIGSTSWLIWLIVVGVYQWGVRLERFEKFEKSEKCGR